MGTDHNVTVSSRLLSKNISKTISSMLRFTPVVPGVKLEHSSDFGGFLPFFSGSQNNSTKETKQRKENL